jgi:uncharacterized protein YlxW (UPF0749 family)
MNWIIEVIKAHTGENDVVNSEGLAKTLKAEFSKNAVSKDQYDALAEKLKLADESLSKLQSEHKDLKDLQAEIENYKAKAQEVQKTCFYQERCGSQGAVNCCRCNRR